MMSFNLDESRKQESSFVTIVQFVPVVLNEFPGHVTAFHTERTKKNNSHFNKKDYSIRLKYSWTSRPWIPNLTGRCKEETVLGRFEWEFSVTQNVTQCVELRLQGVTRTKKQQNFIDTIALIQKKERKKERKKEKEKKIVIRSSLSPATPSLEGN